LQTKKADVDDAIDSGSRGRDSGNEKATKKDRKHNAVAVLRVFFNVRNGSWILTIFFIGLCNGLIWGFLFWHLDNLGNYYHSDLVSWFKAEMELRLKPSVHIK